MTPNKNDVINTEKVGRGFLLLGVRVWHCAGGDRECGLAVALLECLCKAAVPTVLAGLQHPMCSGYRLPTPSTAAENSSGFRAIGDGITKSCPQQQLVLLLPDLVGGWCFAKCINRKGLKKGNVRHQLPSEKTELMEAACFLRLKWLELGNYWFSLLTWLPF